MRFSFWLKALPHSLHLKGFFPLWIFWCLMRYCFWLKALPHWLHSNGFSPVWIFSCSLRYDLPLKAFPHSLHAYGFFPAFLWFLTMVVMGTGVFLDSLGLSSACCFWWERKFPLWLKVLPQSPHVCDSLRERLLRRRVGEEACGNSGDFSPLCIFLCSTKCRSRLKVFLHSSHS